MSLSPQNITALSDCSASRFALFRETLIHHCLKPPLLILRGSNSDNTFSCLQHLYRLKRWNRPVFDRMRKRWFPLSPPLSLTQDKTDTYPISQIPLSLLTHSSALGFPNIQQSPASWQSPDTSSKFDYILWQCLWGTGCMCLEVQQQIQQNPYQYSDQVWGKCMPQTATLFLLLTYFSLNACSFFKLNSPQVSV